MILQQTEEIARFHRGMLALIADKQHPVFVLHRKFHHLRSLPERVQTGFINDQIRALRRQLVLVLQKHCHRLCQFKIFAAQHIHRRIGRSNHMDIVHAAFFEAFAEFLQGGSLARSGNAAKDRERIFRLHNLIDHLNLR